MATSDLTISVSRQDNRLPSERWMWFFILGDMSIFALFFGAYLWDLGGNRDGFTREAASLVLVLGLLNTLLLLSSSYCVARAVQAFRSDDFTTTRSMLGWALAAAGAFVCVKAVEYGMESAEGHGLTTSHFFMYYFVLTGLHLMHVFIGSIFLITWRSSLDSVNRHSHNWVESVAAYWHMVDLLWLLIFAFVYIASSA